MQNFNEKALAATAEVSKAVLGKPEVVLTTIVPLNPPADSQGIFVLYIGTLTPSSICRTGISASSSAASKEKLHPIRKLTRSFRSSK